MAKKKKGESPFTIVDWIITHAPDYGISLTSKQAFVDTATKADDGEGRLAGFASSSKAFTGVSKDSGESIGGVITLKNDEWYNSLRNIARESVDKQDRDLLGGVRQTFDSQKSEYEDDTVTKLQKEIDDAAKEIATAQRQVVIEEGTAERVREQDKQELLKSVADAKNSDDILELPSYAKVRKDLGEDAEREFRKAVDAANERLGTLEEEKQKEISDKIRNAEYASQVRDVDVSQAKTTRSEKELQKLKQDRLKELGG